MAEKHTGPIRAGDVRARLDEVEKWLNQVRAELGSSREVDESAYRRWRNEGVRPLAKDCSETPTVAEVRQRLDRIAAWMNDTLARVKDLADQDVVPSGDYDSWKTQAMDLRPLAKDC